MTNHEAYSMGWVYGYLFRLMGYPENYDPTGKKFEDAGFNPYLGFALIHQEAIRRKVITEDVTKVICEAVVDISPVEGVYRAPLPLVGSWQLGYYLALSGKSLPSNAPDIAGLRKAKGLTQTQLAEMVGCDQAVISRLENKQATPDKAIYDKIISILS